MKSAVPPGLAARATFRDVFAESEFRALWLAQILSVSGDQLARVALTVLVYDRTRSALLAAVTFAASVLPAFIGGVTLSGLADRLPRRQVMIGSSLASGVLVCCMVLPGMPLVVLVVLLFLVTMIGAVFLAARAAVYPEILDGDRYALGTAVTMTTLLFAQVAGFAAGGAVVAILGVRVSLLIDVVTFGASALIIRARVRARPAAARSAPSLRRGPARQLIRPGKPARTAATASVLGGLRLVLGSRALRTPMLFGWLAAFYDLPEGVASPLARAAGGGAVAVGLILAAPALGSAAGALAFGRMVGPESRVRLTGPLAIAACAALVPFAARPGLTAALLILTVSGLFGCYQIAASASFVRAAPAARRSQAFGIAQGGMSLAQSIAIIVAGAAAQHVAPASVIAVSGVIGAICAAALTATVARAWRAGR